MTKELQDLAEVHQQEPREWSGVDPKGTGPSGWSTSQQRERFLI